MPPPMNAPMYGPPYPFPPENFPPGGAPVQPLNPPGAVLQLRLLLLVLILTLVGEGLARKAVPTGGIFIFFFKDIVTLFIGMRVLNMKRPPDIDFLWNAYLAVMFLFIPLVLSTAIEDPILAVFGAKQYLLYPIIAFGMYVAYHESTDQELLRFYRFLAMLLIPTTVLAVYESRLPATHWLNLSVAGETMAGFGAGGVLRVSSSFSFVAQYCLFLNAEMFITIIAISHLENFKRWWKILYLSLIPFLVLGSYITGSRGAVVGNMTIIVIACCLSIFKFEGKTAFRILTVLGMVALSLTVLPIVMPGAFSVYAERESGQMVGYSSEVQERVFSALFGWTGQLFEVPLFGNGLGIMSNGSANLSDYAGSFRNTGMWTETDFATSVFEGGAYMVLVWYGFRYFVIFQVTRRFFSDVSGDITLPAAFCAAFVIVSGITGTMGIQPPVAIWFWFAVGSSLVFWTRAIQFRMQKQGGGPFNGPGPMGPPPPDGPPRVRGRSIYAERLHAEK